MITNAEETHFQTILRQTFSIYQENYQNVIKSFIFHNYLKHNSMNAYYDQIH